MNAVEHVHYIGQNILASTTKNHFTKELLSYQHHRRMRQAHPVGNSVQLRNLRLGRRLAGLGINKSTNMLILSLDVSCYKTKEKQKKPPTYHTKSCVQVRCSVRLVVTITDKPACFCSECHQFYLSYFCNIA